MDTDDTAATPPATEPARLSLPDRLADSAFRLLIGAARALPYERRVPLVGWVFAHVIAPAAGYRRRVRDNLALIFPDMPRAEVRRLCRAVPDNIGRGLVELYSPDEFIARVARRPMTGPGLAAVRAARQADRPVILVTGHFGNFNAPRAALVAEGMPLAGLYRPMDNPRFNAHYVDAMTRIAAPLFPRGKRGMAQMLRHLRQGGMLGILVDQRMAHGVPLPFFGHPAHTALSAAELALKFDAALVPIYGIRRANGLDFDVVVEAPVPHSTPEEMTQALNDSLERVVRDHLDQWFWIHRRWAAPHPDHLPQPTRSGPGG